MATKSTFRNEYVCIVNAMAAARIKSGLTQNELATRLGKAQSYISKIENCQRRMDLLESLEICAVIGVDLAEIINVVKPKENI